VIVYSKDESQAIVIGNVPLSLLVFQHDYIIPAFGVGVLPASELIERRHLRIKDGPKPHYAYLANHRDGKFFGLNNHKYGIEQVFLRPFKKEGKVFLRIILVSYERITDLLELEVPLESDLADKINDISSHFKTPLFRSYEDNNIL
jgi:hypothetical protein